MDIETFREFCLSFSGTTEGLKWGEHLCFMIEEKMFVIISLENQNSFSFKVNPDDFDTLVARNGIQQAAYMAKRQWVHVENLEILPDDELKERITQSRALIIGKLTKKLQAKYNQQ